MSDLPDTQSVAPRRTDAWPAVRRQGEGLPHGVVMGALAFALACLYLLTLHPGVEQNDRAEMQYMIPLLGIAHPPGYPFLMVCGKLFLLLPIPGSAALRLNLLQAILGVADCVLLYAIVRRITGQIVPGLVAAGVLAFSSVFWKSATVAEVYVFYAWFLLFGVYCAVRFVQSDRAGWLAAGALSLGVCVFNRPSELFVLPAFLLLWLGVRRSVRLGWRRLALAGVLFVLPFGLSVAYFVVRYDPQAVWARDARLHDEILGQTTEYCGWRNLPQVVRYCLGLKWNQRVRFSRKRAAWDADKLLWLLSGRGAFGDRAFPETSEGVIHRKEQGRGTSVGLPALLLALLGVAMCRARWGWLGLALGLILGNTAFYFYHTPPNNLDFITPMIAGLAMLAGFGVAGWRVPPRVSWPRVAVQGAGLIAPLFLVYGNYHVVDRSGPDEHARQRLLRELARVRLPENAALVASRRSAMVYRYLYYVEAGRRDIIVLHDKPDKWVRLADGLARRGYAVYFHGFTEPYRARIRRAGIRHWRIMPGTVGAPRKIARRLERPGSGLYEYGFTRYAPPQ